MILAVNRDFSRVLVGRLIAAIVALVAIRVVTTLLTPIQYGELSLLITVQMFCGLFLVNPIGQYINLHTHQWWDEGTLANRLRPFRYYVFAVSIIGGIGAVFISQGKSPNDLLYTAMIMSTMVMAATWNATLVWFLNMLGFRASSVLWSSITVITGLVASIILVYLYQSAVAWFAGQAVGMAIGAIGAKLALKQRGLQISQSLNELPLFTKDTVFVYCAPLALATGLMWMQLSGYRFFIEHYWGLVELGFLAVGFQLAGQVFSLLESLAMQFFYPMFFRSVSDHEDKLVVQQAFSDLLNTLIPLYLVLAGLVILNAPYLLKVLVAPQYHNAVFFVVLGACIELCRVLANLISNAAHVKRNTKVLVIPYLLGSFATISLICFFGSTQKNINFAVVGLLVGNVVMLITMLVSMYQQIKFSLDSVTCFASVSIMFIMIGISLLMPSPTDIFGAIIMLFLTASISGAIVFGLLYKNPAVMRLIRVQLRSESQ